MSLNIGQTSNFSPNQISGCHIWLDASTSNNFTFSSGSNISTWIDRSSNTYTATAANSPRYDSVNKRVWFSGASSQYMSNLAAPLNLAQRSFFFVLQEITNANVCGIMPIIPSPTTGNDYQTTNGMTIEGTTGVLFYANNGGYNNKAVAAVPLAKGLYGETFASSSGTAYVNGTGGNSSNSSFSFGTSAGYGLGGRWANGMTTPYFNGYFHEVVVFNVSLSTSNRQIMEGYLAWKWGLNRSLPTTHPYYNTPVYSLNMPNVIFPLYSYPIPLFQPTFLSNCTLWLDAADRSTVSAAGASVTQWRDKSGNANHASVVGTINYTALIGGLPAMNYPGTAPNYFTGALINNGTTLTAFSVFLMNSASYTVARILSLSKTGSFDYNNALYTAAIQRNAANFSAYRNNVTLGSIAATFGSAVQVTSIYNGTNHTLYLNGTAGTTVNTTGNFGYSNYEVGGSFGEESLVPLSGAVGEVITFNAALNTTQRQQVEGYLTWKWGIQGSLDASHPYKSFAFETLPPFPEVTLSKSATNDVFNPKSISNLAFWVDANDPFGNGTKGTEGQTISNWQDKSTNAYSATVVSAPKISKKSANGLDTMYFDGTLRGYKYTSFTINTASHSFFFVGKSPSVTANTGYNYVIAFQDPAGGSPYIVYPYYNTGVSGMKGYITSFDSTPLDYTNSTLVDNAIANTLAISCAVIESGNQKIYKNGALQSSNTQSLTSSTSPYLFLGNYPAASGYHFEGTLCEVIIFTSTISNTNREKIEGYLAWKWGLVSSLPSTHPYKLFPPPP